MLNELFKLATDYIFIDQGEMKRALTYDEIIRIYGMDCEPEEVYMDILRGK